MDSENSDAEKELRNTFSVFSVLEVYKTQSNNLEVLRFAASGDAARLGT